MLEGLGRYYMIRLVVAAVILFIVSVVGSCNEAKYALLSKRATARVFKAYDVTSRDEGVEHVVIYRFKDANGDDQIGGFDEASPGSFPIGSTVQVDYFTRHSRLSGTHEWIWPIILGSSLVFGLLCSIPLILEARQATRELEASRRKYKY
jgi:hypothetical protein